jgi:hypothetical protein
VPGFPGIDDGFFFGFSLMVGLQQPLLGLAAVGLFNG